jgi:two-component system response regulator HydG
LAAEGLFREDLYYRLNVIELLIPPLRERGNDIIEIALVLLEKTCQKLHVNALSFDEDSIAAMLAYTWPGNVRELENAIERAVILAEGKTISPDLLAIDLDIPLLTKTPEPRFDANVTIKSTVKPPINNEIPDISHQKLNETEFQDFILMHQEQLSETELAKRLGISRKSLWERRQRMGIPRRRPTGD